jgi:hypothetical protein
MQLSFTKLYFEKKMGALNEFFKQTYHGSKYTMVHKGKEFCCTMVFEKQQF